MYSEHPDERCSFDLLTLDRHSIFTIVQELENEKG